MSKTCVYSRPSGRALPPVFTFLRKSARYTSTWPYLSVDASVTSGCFVVQEKTRPSRKADLPLHVAVADAQVGSSEDEYVPCGLQVAGCSLQLAACVLEVAVGSLSLFDCCPGL